MSLSGGRGSCRIVAGRGPGRGRIDPRRRTTPRSRGRSTTSAGGTARRRRCGSLRPRRSRVPPAPPRRRPRAAPCAGTPRTAGRSTTRPRPRSSGRPGSPHPCRGPLGSMSGDAECPDAPGAETSGPQAPAAERTTGALPMLGPPWRPAPSPSRSRRCPSTCASPASRPPTPPAGRASTTSRSTTSASR